MSTDERSNTVSMPATGGWLVTLAGAAALAAAYWDDAWHTTIGRDDALIPPHLLLFAATAVVGLIVAGWGLLVLVRTKSLRTVLTTPGLLLAGAGGLTTVGTAFADAAWHSAFGRDAVLWSPPHLLSVIAMAVLVVAVLVGVDRRLTALSMALGAVLLGAAQLVVLEYDTDVPQFAEALYVPLLVAIGLATAWVVRRTVAAPFAVTWALAGYVLFRLVAFGVLTGTGWPAPDLPIALLGLALLDVPAKWGVLRWSAAGAAMTVLQVSASAAGISGTGLAAAGSSGVVTVLVLALPVLFRVGPRFPAAGLVAGMVGLSGLLIAPPARAHDPGQGDEVATAVVRVAVDGTGRLAVRVDDVQPGQGQVRPLRLVARRAGRTVTGDLVSESTGAYRGSIELPSTGLWFVYAELDFAGRRVETWVSVPRERDTPIAERRSVYLPAEAGPARLGQYVAGGALLLVGLGLLVWAGHTVRRSRRYPTVSSSS